MAQKNVTGIQWIASEAWTLIDGLHISAFMPYLGGTLGIAIRRGKIPGLRDFLLKLHPKQHNNDFLSYSMVRD